MSIPCRGCGDVSQKNESLAFRRHFLQSCAVRNRTFFLCRLKSDNQVPIVLLGRYKLQRADALGFDRRNSDHGTSRRPALCLRRSGVHVQICVTCKFRLPLSLRTVEQILKSLEDAVVDLHSNLLHALLQAVRRNQKRFPPDLVFSFNSQELMSLRSQFVTSKTAERRGGQRYEVYAFTEQRGGDAVQRSSQRYSSASEHRNHAGVRSPAPGCGC
jgi:hypothetical protein